MPTQNNYGLALAFLLGDDVLGRPFLQGEIDRCLDLELGQQLGDGLSVNTGDRYHQKFRLIGQCAFKYAAF
jgi:hypothetical protein